jgi:aryl-alcohol dehydrogenase-like predicted oxidoreductase
VRLALGTAQFGLEYGVANRHGRMSEADARAIVACARDCGIDTLDTAIEYGDAEARLGAIGLKDWHVVTKLPAVPEGCGDISDWVRAETDASRRRLRVDRLYGVLLHRPLQLLDPGGALLYDSLLQLVRDGTVRKIGISIYDPVELDAILPDYPVDIVQAPFNLVDRRLADSGWLDRASQSGIELHIRSVLLQGLLVMSSDERPARFARWSPLWREYDLWLAETELTPLAACLRFALSYPQVHRVLIGVYSSLQLEAAVQASSGTIEVPDSLRCNDPVLLNPARWGEL